jgi:hypothetical protein
MVPTGSLDKDKAIARSAAIADVCYGDADA